MPVLSTFARMVPNVYQSRMEAVLALAQDALLDNSVKLVKFLLVHLLYFSTSNFFYATKVKLYIHTTSEVGLCV